MDSGADVPSALTVGRETQPVVAMFAIRQNSISRGTIEGPSGGRHILGKRSSTSATAFASASRDSSGRDCWDAQAPMRLPRPREAK